MTVMATKRSTSRKPTPKQLKALRERLQLTQSAIAEKLSVHLTTWQKWEYGERQPNAAAVALIRLLEQNRF